MKFLPPIPRVSRRLMIGGAAAGLATSFTAAAAGPPRRPAYQAEQYRPIPQIGDDYEPDRNDAPERPDRPPEPARDYQPPIDAVRFWSDASIEVCGLDHSIDAKEARAFGPVAAQRAMALAHVAMADAVAAVYPVDWQGLLVRRQPRRVPYPDVFVGGAVAGILGHIYDTQCHSLYLATRRLRFLVGREPGAFRAWDAGLRFGRDEAFTRQWVPKDIAEANIQSAVYVVPPRGHVADPFNPEQGFLGINWARIPPITPNFGPLGALGPGNPPGERDEEYRDDYEDVLKVGVYHENEPTAEQVQSGLFWAYCGARLVGPPARLYTQVIRRIIEDDHVQMQDAARMLALTALAQADAGQVCWGAKYYYRLWRPVVAIRERGVDWRPFGGPRTNPIQFALGQDGSAPQRLPYHLACFTPPFPSYPSGHATFAGAGFGILRKLRAEYMRDPDRINPKLQFVSEEVDGVNIDNFLNRPRPYVPRTFSSITEMLKDVERSRIFLGVHWNFDCKYGTISGLKIADAVYANAYRRRLERHDAPRERYPETSQIKPRRGERVVAHR